MNKQAKTFTLLTLTSLLAFLLAVAIRVLVPAIKRSVDKEAFANRLNETRIIMDALYQYADGNTNLFPKKLSDIERNLNGITNQTPLGRTWVNAFNDYIYIQPPPRRRGEVDDTKIVLAEKLGHYRFRDGAFVGTVGGVVSWRLRPQYQLLLANFFPTNITSTNR
jgi:hypothetical protein